eukprot:TRINITY_DN46903_c0_g1_i1.p1 TRINITY_DN46903_c0_g1~~TRINITY_DN46903_c0_g1_i1.p1  ORF type:complete len:527 (+),score=40.66 TRINITY_DN46903_c0_g1_i1:189-1769(+)
MVCRAPHVTPNSDESWWLIFSSQLLLADSSRTHNCLVSSQLLRLQRHVARRRRAGIVLVRAMFRILVVYAGVHAFCLEHGEDLTPLQSNDLWPADNEPTWLALYPSHARGAKAAACEAEGRAALTNQYSDFASIMDSICLHVSTAQPRVSQQRRWEGASKALGEAETQLRKIIITRLSSDVVNGFAEFSALQALKSWIFQVALQAEVYELKVLEALIIEALFWKLRERHPWQSIVSMASSMVLNYKRAGRLADARRAYNAVMQTTWPSRKMPPLSRWFDTGDYRRVSGTPVPGLSPLPIPASVDPLLSSELVASLKRDWPALAQEAQAAVKQMKVAWPQISAGEQWRQMGVYDLDKGWDKQVCEKSLPKLCSLLRGRLPFDEAKLNTWKDKRCIVGNDVEVAVFAVEAGGFAQFHVGTDKRVNVHLCLANCNSSRIVVGGESLPYHDGSLFAFEDRADHEVLNDAKAGEPDRLNLVIGLLHPSFNPDVNDHHCDPHFSSITDYTEPPAPKRRARRRRSKKTRASEL